MEPSAFSAKMSRASSEALMPSCSQIKRRRLRICSMVKRLKSKRCTRLKMGCGTLLTSGVAKMKITCSGGSSSVLRSALKAPVESMWTSSIMKILYLPMTGGYCTRSITSRMLSTPVLEAASISKTSIGLPPEMSLQLSHCPQGCSGSPPVQFSVRARIRALVVLPTPRVPVNRNAWCRRPPSIAF